MIDQKILDQLTAAMTAVLPTGLSKEIETNVRAALNASLDRLGLVTREELEVQEAVLARTRERLHALEKTVEALEKQLLKK